MRVDRRNIIMIMIVLLMDFLMPSRPDPQRQSISTLRLTGRLYYDELMADNCNRNTFLNVARMPVEIFGGLLQLLIEQGGLDDSIHLSAGEKLMAFMYLLSTGCSMRQLGHRWQHSTSTLHHCMNEVLRCILNCKNILMIPVDETEPLPEYISSNPKLFPFLENCKGALDGTFVSASVSAAEFEVFKCRKGYTAQNILLVVRFDMSFSYILAGWEGTAHDGRVLQDAYTKGLARLPNQFYLGDAGYCNTRSLKRLNS